MNKKDCVNQKLIHFTSDRYLSMYNFILLLAKKFGKETLVEKVKDSYFGNNDLKPKFLGLKSNYKYCNKTLVVEEFVENYE